MDIQADFWACVGKSPQNAAVHTPLSAPFPEKGQTSPISGCGKFSSGDGQSVYISTSEHGIQAEAILDVCKCFLFHFACPTFVLLILLYHIANLNGSGNYSEVLEKTFFLLSA